MNHLSGSYNHAQITQWLGHSPEFQHHPQLAAELLLALRSANHHSVLPATVQTLGQAILTCVDPRRAIAHLLRYLDCSITAGKRSGKPGSTGRKVSPAP